MSELKEMNITEAAAKAGEILDFIKPLQRAQEVLTTAASVERQTVAAQANLERIHASLKEHTANLERVTKEFAQVRAELEAGRAELDTLTVEKEKAHLERDRTLKEITIKRNELNDLGSRLDQARKTLL